MNRDGLRQKIEVLLDSADVKIDGDRPWDPHVHDDRLYERVLRQGSLGLGESYMDGWWECESLDGFFCRILATELDTRLRSWAVLWEVFKARLFNLQTPSFPPKVFPAATAMCLESRRQIRSFTSPRAQEGQDGIPEDARLSGTHKIYS